MRKCEKDKGRKAHDLCEKNKKGKIRVEISETDSIAQKNCIAEKEECILKWKWIDADCTSVTTAEGTLTLKGLFIPLFIEQL